MPRRALLRAALIACAAAGVAALFVFHGPNWGQVGHALAEMNWWWAAAAVGLNLASAIARGMSWRTVVDEAVPPPHPRVFDIFSAFFIGIFANGVLPGRVGEVARVGVLTRRMPERERPGLWPALLGSVLAHRILEVFPSIALILWVITAAKIPAWAHTSLWAVFGVACAFLIFGVAVATRHERGGAEGRGRLRAILERVREGLGILRRPGPALVSAGYQTAAWGLQLGAVWVALLAFHLHEPLIAAGAVLALMNVALILPLWPGNVGLQQAAIALPLTAYHVAYSRGFAYGIALQAIESSVGYAGGLIFLAREGISLGGLRRLSARAADTI
ncbi:MAG TPA: lysylphosphatidylglycerol synthase transmembrane domain-containing protein [Gaiellaceae bacterium]|nr:lysylphosphatidylglycerol synthase transmembrane domain-containing protein [Gaiellaceae bacterium]